MCETDPSPPMTPSTAGGVGRGEGRGDCGFERLTLGEIVHVGVGQALREEGGRIGSDHGPTRTRIADDEHAGSGRSTSQPALRVPHGPRLPSPYA